MSRHTNHQTKLIATDLSRLMGALIGGTLAYFIASNLQLLLSAFICSIAIAFASYAGTRVAKPLFWWFNLGAIAGSILGTGSVLADYLKVETTEVQGLEIRAMVIGFLGIAGFFSGFFLHKSLKKPDVPHPKEFIKSVSGLTAGVFAVIVTISFIFQGLEPARTLSSRLSATTTILATSVAIPGWGGYLLGRLLRLDKTNQRQSP
ncbi:MAG TPA: hypothetical protein ACFCUY_19070 [Xenococcaceae cyanobacterium]